MSDTVTNQSVPDAEFYPTVTPGPSQGSLEEADKERIVVTDEEAVAVAKAMDPDHTLVWDSLDHSEIVACANAKEEARIFILGCRAVGMLEGGKLKVEEPAPSFAMSNRELADFNTAHGLPVNDQTERLRRQSEAEHKQATVVEPLPLTEPIAPVTGVEPAPEATFAAPPPSPPPVQVTA
jgi:hypothetical protein